MTPITILSPHLDDGALSCGGRIWLAAQRAQPVRVVTLFAGAPLSPVPPFAQVQHEMWGNPPDPNRLRRAEDIAAYARLGCFDVHHLEAPDAVYRSVEGEGVLYGSEEQIFGQVHPREASYDTVLARLVRPYLLPGSTLLAPLGAGNHVDHQLAHSMGRMLLEAGWKVAFYEELPYVEQDGALEHARSGKAGWRDETLLLPDEAIASKVAAVAYYRTQIPVLYGNDEEMERRVREVARQVAGGAGYAERVWWPRAEP